MKVAGSTNRTELASYYGVCRATLSAWLKAAPHLNVRKGSRAIDPATARRIMEHLGEPLMRHEITQQ